jgi:hypothetical protein
LLREDGHHRVSKPGKSAANRCAGSLTKPQGTGVKTVATADMGEAKADRGEDESHGIR